MNSSNTTQILKFPQSIPGNYINCLFRDSHNRLWVGTNLGIALYDVKDYFKRIPINGMTENVRHIFEDREGRIFIDLAIQILMYNESTGMFDLVIDDLDKMNISTWPFVDHQNHIWIVTPTSIRHYSPDDFHLIESVDAIKNITYATKSMTTDNLMLASFGSLYLYSTKEKRYFDTSTNAFSHNEALSTAMITQIMPYSNTSILLRTAKSGLFLDNFKTHDIIGQWQASFPFEVPDINITTMFMDSQNNLWLGSDYQGFKVIYGYKERFNGSNFLSRETRDKSILSIAYDKDRNDIWMVAKNTGLILLEEKDRNEQVFDNSVLFPFKTAFQFKAAKVLVSSDSKIWILSDWMISRFAYSRGILSLEKQYFNPKRMLSFAEDENGTIWVGGESEQIWRIPNGGSKLVPFALFTKGFTWVIDIKRLSTGEMAIAALNRKITIVDPADDSRREIDIMQRDTAQKMFLPSCLFEDSRHNLWIGTNGNGLYCENATDGKIVHFRQTQCQEIASVQEDSQGNIWISTLDGLAKYDRTTNRMSLFFSSDGIGGNNFNFLSSCILPDNTLLFGGFHGLTHFNPIDVNIKRDIPFAFEYVKADNMMVNTRMGKLQDKAVFFRPTVKIDYRTNNVSIAFASLDYANPGRENYYWKLEGYDHEWINGGNAHEAFYSHLPGKNYTFRVKAFYSDGTKIGEEHTLKISVAKYPMLRWWAWLLYIAMLAAALMEARKLRLNFIAGKEQVKEEKRQREQEENMNRMNMSFFTNISHEFRTPLTVISGPVSQLASDRRIPEDDKELLSIVSRSVQRMLRLVNQMMEFNKLENDMLRLKVHETDIVGLLIRLIDSYRPLAENKEVAINTFGLEDDCLVWIDDEYVDNIITNLMSNAMKFVHIAGTVNVKLDVVDYPTATGFFPQLLKLRKQDDAYVKISVSDTGQTIPENELEKIFEKYYQVENNKGGYNVGTGIGLYFAKSLVEMHHGMIKAENMHEDGKEGARFIFIVPASESSYTENEKASSENEQTRIQDNAEGRAFPVAEYSHANNEESKKIEGRESILVVDDDIDIVRYLKSLLGSKYNVTGCYDAASALKSARENAPDIILCDVIMPGHNGYELCGEIKRDLQLCHIPVILVSAKASTENQIEGLNTGADAYVTKPFNPEFLLATINSQLMNRKKIQSLLSHATKIDTPVESSEGKAMPADILSPQDKKFMAELYELMEKEISNPELNITKMTSIMKISRTKFYYKVKGLTGENPNVFFKTYKLNRAVELLKEGRYNISEIADLVGFSTPSHFTVCFKRQFGVAPSEYK